MDVKELIRELAERIERTANVKAVFGEPMGEGNDSLIPVATVRVRGGGGGGGGEDNPKGRGMGMGMNIVSSPVGYIKRTPDGPVFVPIIDKSRVMMVALGAGGMGLWAAKALMMMGMKKRARV